MIVRMDWCLATQNSTHDFNGPIADDFVDVHVRLSARTGLPNDQWKVIFVQGTINNLLSIKS